MVDPLGVYTLLITAFLVAGVFIGYYISEDFTGIAFGLAMAVAFTYIPRNLWLGIASKVVGGP